MLQLQPDGRMVATKTTTNNNLFRESSTIVFPPVATQHQLIHGVRQLCLLQVAIQCGMTITKTINTITSNLFRKCSNCINYEYNYDTTTTQKKLRHYLQQLIQGVKQLCILLLQPSKG